MDVLILSSASEKIDNYYLSVSKSISSYLADYGCNLVYGASSTSMMGTCYEEFKKKNREIYAFTTHKYKDDLVNLEGAKKFVREDTFMMKKSMYENCDLVVVLPGGGGTLSEFTSYIEENRSNDKDIPIIVYNEGGFFNTLFMFLNEIYEKQFAGDDFISGFKVANNKYEFESAFQDVLYNKERGKSYGK